MAAPQTAPTLETLNLMEEVRKLKTENEQLWDRLIQQAEDFAYLAQRVKSLEALPHPGPTTAKIHARKMKTVDHILASHSNQFMSFADMGKLLGYPEKTRSQNMTHLAKVFKQFPDRYEVKASKLGGKLVKLTGEYLNHILKGGD